MTCKPPAPEAALGRLTSALKAYGLYSAVDPIVEKVVSLLSSADEKLSLSDVRRLKLARAALRAARTHFARLFSPPVDEPARRGRRAGRKAGQKSAKHKAKLIAIGKPLGDS